MKRSDRLLTYGNAVWAVLEALKRLEGLAESVPACRHASDCHAIHKAFGRTLLAHPGIRLKELPASTPTIVEPPIGPAVESRSAHEAQRE
jgi:hypothetical protein